MSSFISEHSKQCIPCYAKFSVKLQSTNSFNRNFRFSQTNNYFYVILLRVVLGFQIHGYTGEFTIRVSCVSEDEPYVPHPHYLTGNYYCLSGVYTKQFSNTDTVSFPQLKILCARKRSIEKRLRFRKTLGVDPFQSEYH